MSAVIMFSYLYYLFSSLIKLRTYFIVLSFFEVWFLESYDFFDISSTDLKEFPLIAS